jgi:hypothetical protein
VFQVVVYLLKLLLIGEDSSILKLTPNELWLAQRFIEAPPPAALQSEPHKFGVVARLH